MILLDTNLLTRLTSTGHPHGMVARVAAHKLLARRDQLVIVPQICTSSGQWRREIPARRQ